MSSNLTFKGIVDVIIADINLVIPVLIALALLGFMVTVLRYLLAAGDSKHGNAYREAIMWSLAALFVLISLWGILRFMRAAFLPTTPSVENGVYPNI